MSRVTRSQAKTTRTSLNSTVGRPKSKGSKGQSKIPKNPVKLSPVATSSTLQSISPKTHLLQNEQKSPTEKGHTCPACQQAFPTTRGVNGHMIRVHKISQVIQKTKTPASPVKKIGIAKKKVDPSSPQPITRVILAKKEEVTLEIEKSPVDLYTCPTCNKPFGSKRSVNLHSLSAHRKTDSFIPPKESTTPSDLEVNIVEESKIRTHSTDPIDETDPTIKSDEGNNKKKGNDMDPPSSSVIDLQVKTDHSSSSANQKEDSPSHSEPSPPKLTRIEPQVTEHTHTLKTDSGRVSTGQHCCPHCDYKSRHVHHLKSHMRNHSTKVTISTEVKSENTTSSVSPPPKLEPIVRLEKIKQVKFEDKVHKFYYCDQDDCNFSTMSSVQLTIHMRRHGRPRRQPLKCRGCNCGSSDLVNPSIGRCHHSGHGHKKPSQDRSTLINKLTKDKSRKIKNVINFKCKRCRFSTGNEKQLATHYLLRHQLPNISLCRIQQK